MSDFLAWFLVRHWFVSAVLFPEVAFVFAVWQRYTARATVLGLIVAIYRGRAVYDWMRVL